MDFDLPWKPIYTQSSGEFDWAGGISAANATTGKDSFSPLAYWSLAGTIAFTLLVYVVEGNLDARQKRSYQITEFPEELEKTVAKIDAQKSEDDKKDEDEDSKPLLEQLQEKFKSSQAYGMDKINFGMIAGTYETFESVAILLLGFTPFLWDQSVRLGGKYLGIQSDEEIKITLVFLFLQSLIETIKSLPFELYKTFKIEKKHGFNKQTYGLFFSDKVKSFILSCVIGGPFIALMLKIIKVGSKILVSWISNLKFECLVLIPNSLLVVFSNFAIMYVTGKSDGRRELLHLSMGLHSLLFNLYDDNRSSRDHAAI